MNKLVLSVVAVGAATVCLAQAPIAASRKTATTHENHSLNGLCLLGTDCMGVGKIPGTVCPVGGESPKTRDACAVSGMKLVGKFEVGDSRI